MVTRKQPVRRKRTPRPKPEKTIFADIIAMGERIPDNELKRIPQDAAANFDHYMEGAPKQR